MFRRIFKTRSPDRDRKADIARMGSIVVAVGHAIEEYESERLGLKQRIDDFHATAVSIIDDAEFEYRETHMEAKAASSEQQASVALLRIRSIDEHLDVLRSIEVILKTKT